MKTLLKALFLTLALIFSSWANAEWLPTPPPKAQLCTRCHGVAGNSTNPRYPKLAGQHEAYILKQLFSFQEGDQGSRPQPLMNAIAKNLSLKECLALADYFSYQKPIEGFARNSQLELGKTIYLGGLKMKGVPACSACHNPAGAGNSAAKIPRLGGQHSAYIVQQLQNFQQHQRRNDPKQIMQDIASRLSADEINAVANYINGLH